MKRSESILVYGVTGVLAVILGVAIIFGGEDPDTRTTGRADASNLTGSGDELLVDEPGSSRQPRDLLEEFLELPPVDPVESEPEPGDSQPEDAFDGLPLNRKTAAALGSFRVGEDSDGVRYRYVEVRVGDTVGELIQKWCPGTELTHVAALNETLDFARLRPGQTICLPWVDEGILLEAAAARTARSQPVAAAAATPAIVPSAAPAVAPGSGEEYVVREGESLWSIAAKRVGAAGATAYIDQILALNPSISDPSRVRAKQKIRLP